MASVRPVTDFASTVLAPNPGTMTLDGTNSYVLRADHGRAVIVDPGPEDDTHLETLAGVGDIALILITHRHLDHTEGAATLHRLTGAPVRAPRAEDCFGPGTTGAGMPNGGRLVDGEDITVDGLRIRVVATPGHSADSVCFHLPADRALQDRDGDDGRSARAGARDRTGRRTGGSVLTGDTVLGRGSTVIGAPDGTLAQYLQSLRTIIALGDCRGLPAHGPILDDLPAACRRYLDHRQERLGQLRDAMARLGVDAHAATVEQLTDAVYGDVDPSIRFAAERSVATQLEYLRDSGNEP